MNRADSPPVRLIPASRLLVNAAAAVLIATLGCTSTDSRLQERVEERKITSVVKAKGLTSDQLDEIAVDRASYEAATWKDSIERSKKLLRWIDVGDSRAWVIFVFGEVKPNALGQDESADPSTRPVRGQDFIIFFMREDKVDQIERMWICG